MIRIKEKYPNIILFLLGSGDIVDDIKKIITQNNLRTGMSLKPVYQKICENLDGKEIYTYVFEPI